MPSRSATRSECANAIRALSMDAVQKANSGHPGAPMGMADIAEVLWNDYLQHNPANPDWLNRDRFVLSNGHGSMLLYSLLHLSGYGLNVDDLKNFRQLHSKTPGHPEYGYAPGIETTTGPLGQGIANAVGMAIAEKTLAAQFNRDDHAVVDHKTYVFMGDGCLMEGISHEVCSLAGTLKLGKLIGFYDDNGISIDGQVDGWFTDDTSKRFEAYGWQVLAVDGHNSEEIIQAIETAKSNTSQPTLIACKTIIGYGSPNKQGTAGAHGAALGTDEITAARQQLGWRHEPFVVPENIYQQWNAEEQGQQLESEWQQGFDAYQSAHPQLAAELLRRSNKQLPVDFAEKAAAYIKATDSKAESIASRKASQNCLNAYGELLPELIGGSADLAGSNNTIWSGSKKITDDAAGNYIDYGVREFGMTAIMNGIALHSGFIPYGGTFLVFMEYARNAARMAAILKQRNILVYTHDSIGLGEDGPTHQPVEQMANLRSTPNMSLWRPCDAVESALAWKVAIERSDGPTALIFSRQSLPHQQRSQQQLSDMHKGAYILKDVEGVRVPSVILIATGSEVSLAMQAADQLAAENIPVRVVSMPSVDVFEQQDEVYRESVLPKAVRQRVAVEAAAVDYWYKYVGLDGKVVGMNSFGESAPAADVFRHFGITVENIIATVKSLLD